MRSGPIRNAFLGALAAVALALGAIAPGPARAEEVGPPLPPSSVTARVVADGVLVSWTPSPASAPAIESYIVHAGQNSCPVRVDAGASSVVMPVVRGQRSIVVQVRAANEYGYSADVPATKPVDVQGRASDRYRAVQFLQFSDFHGALEASTANIGAAVLSAALAQDRARVKPTFTVSAGDNFGGAPVISSAFEELPSVEVLNAMKLDVSTFGNHEHDRPLSHLRRMIDAAKFDWVVSNYSTLAPLQGKRNGAKPYVLKQRDGITVGFVGMNTEDAPLLVARGNFAYGKDLAKRIEVAATATTVNRQVRAARAAGAQVVVALLHQGFSSYVAGAPTGRLIDIARQLRGVDLIYGAHTHTVYLGMIAGRPVTEVPNSAREYSRTTSCLDTQANRVIGSMVDLEDKAEVADVSPDPVAAQIVAKYKALLGARLDGKVGVVDGIFPRGGNPPVERSGETPIGDFAADAVRAHYGTDFAFLAGGGFRDTLPAAGYQPVDPTLRRPTPGSSGPYDVTLGDMVALLPFGNNAATTTITGDALWQALENGVSGWPADGRFPQISGFRFAFDPSRPKGSRILEVTKADGTPIPRDGARYSVTTVDFMLYGGDGYGELFSPSTATLREPYVDIVADALRRDAAAGRVTPVPQPDGRITRTG